MIHLNEPLAEAPEALLRLFYRNQRPIWGYSSTRGAWRTPRGVREPSRPGPAREGSLTPPRGAPSTPVYSGRLPGAPK